MPWKALLLHRGKVLSGASLDRATMRGVKVVDDEAECCDVLAMWLARSSLADVEEEERVTLAELPSGVDRRPPESPTSSWASNTAS